MQFLMMDSVSVKNTCHGASILMESMESVRYNDVIMDSMASQITSLTIVYLAVYSWADQRKHQSYASLAFVRGIHRGPVNFPHKRPVTRKMFPFDDVIMWLWQGSSVERGISSSSSRGNTTANIKGEQQEAQILKFNSPLYTLSLPRPSYNIFFSVFIWVLVVVMNRGARKVLHGFEISIFYFFTFILYTYPNITCYCGDKMLLQNTFPESLSINDYENVNKFWDIPLEIVIWTPVCMPFGGVGSLCKPSMGRTSPKYHFFVILFVWYNDQVDNLCVIADDLKSMMIQGSSWRNMLLAHRGLYWYCFVFIFSHFLFVTPELI